MKQSKAVSNFWKWQVAISVPEHIYWGLLEEAAKVCPNDGNMLFDMYNMGELSEYDLCKGLAELIEQTAHQPKNISL